MATVNEVFRDYTVDGVPSSGVWNPVKSEIRALLNDYPAPAAANLSFYVRDDGDNDHDGSANTAGSAWLTLNYAIEYVYANINLKRNAVTIFAEGTFAENVVVSGGAQGDAGLGISIVGPGDPADFVISPASGICFTVQYGAIVSLQNCRFVCNAANSIGVEAIFGGYVFLVNPSFGACSLHMYSTRRGYIDINGDYEVDGIFGTGVGRHVEVTHQGNVRWTGVNQVCTVTGTLPMLYWCNVQSQGDYTVTNTVVGTASFNVSGATVTGVRYNVQGHGHIQWAGPLGGSHTAFPGNAAGFVDAHSVIWFAEIIPAMKVITTTFDVATTGALALTGFGFKPSAVMILAAVNNSSRMSIGAHGFGAGMVRDDHGITAEAWTAGATSSYFLVTDSSNFANGVVASFDSDGFTLTRSKTGTPTGTATLIAIAFP